MTTNLGCLELMWPCPTGFSLPFTAVLIQDSENGCNDCEKPSSAGTYKGPGSRLKLYKPFSP